MTPTPGAAHPPGAIPLVALLAVGLALRLPGLDRGLWFDEIQTLLDYVRQPWGVLLGTFDSTNQHLLYSISARAVITLLGESALALRLPAVLFGVASLWAAVAFGRRWMPAREAWWCGVLLAVSYQHVWFSQNARGYTGLLLGTLVTTALFHDLLKGVSATTRTAWYYAVAVTLSVLIHVTALVVVAAHALTWLWQARRLPPGPGRWRPFGALALAGVLTLAVYAPLLPQVVTAVAGSGTSPVATAWQNPAWMVAETLRGLVRGIPAGVVVVPAALLVALAGVASAWRRDRVATVLMLLPLGIMAALVLGTGHNLWPRFFFFGAAFLVQLAVRGGFAVLERVVPARAGPVGSAGLAVATAGSLALLPAAWAPKQDFRAALAWVEEHAGAGDAVVATPMLEMPMNRWLGQSWPVVEDAAALQAIEAGHSRTLVAYTFPIRLAALHPDLWARLDSAYQTAHVVPGTVGGGEIVIMTSSPIPPSPPRTP